VLAEFPVIAKTVLQADDHVVTLLLTLFALGVGSGSLACARLLRDQVSPRLVPFAILGISLFTADFALTCDQGGVAGLHSVSALLAAPIGWRIMGELFLLAFCGGLYSVPLYAILQEDSPPECRARMVGCNNVLNALFMVAGAGGAAALAAIHWTAPAILLLTATLNLMVALACVAMLARHYPDALPAWLRGRL